MSYYQYQPIQNANREEANKTLKFKTHMNILSILSTFKNISGIVYSGIIISNLPPYLPLVEGEVKEKDEMKSMSNDDDYLATAHIVMCLIFLILGYSLFFYGRCSNRLWFIIFGLISLNFWDIVLGDLAITITIMKHRKRLVAKLESYPRQELVHELNNAYNNIFDAHWIIFSIKMALLLVSFIDLFYMASNCRRLLSEFE